MLAPTQKFQLGAAPKFALGAVAQNVLAQPAARRGILRVGTERSIDGATLAQGKWQQTSDGANVWRLALNSEGALGVRVHFTSFAVGTGQVWVHDTASPAAQVFGPYTGTGRNQNGDFWTEVVFSNEIEVEYQPASGAAAGGTPPFQVSELGHMWKLGPYSASSPTASATSNSVAATAVSAAGSTTATPAARALNYSCFLNAECYVSSHAEVASAVGSTALILFTDSGSEYQCSGTLLNAPSGTPLFLTAGHCIDNNASALSLIAFFNLTTPCGNANFGGEVSDSALSLLPQATGAALLSYAERPFISTDPTDPSNVGVPDPVDQDLDYSLVQLSAYPSGDVSLILSGYTINPLAIGGLATSVSSPGGQYLSVAFGTRVDSTLYEDSYFTNSYEIDQSTDGRIDSGSSGSGIFDSTGHLLGLLSTGTTCANPLPDGSCPANSTACDVPAPFDTWYTQFSAIYPYIQTYLEGTGSSPLPTNSAVFSATPNPINVTDGTGLGQTTLNINATGTTHVQIRVGSPSGGLLYDGAPVGTSMTGKWVTNGMVFYLQDLSNNKALTLENTIATVTITVGAASLTATPDVIQSATGVGVATLTWSAPNSQSGVELRVGSPTGPLFAEGGSSGSATTGLWVINGTQFFLVDSVSRAVAASTTIQVVSDPLATQGGSGSGQSDFYATPNPITPTAGETYGQTNLFWNTSASSVQVHVGSPTGPLFAAGGSAGSSTTGVWVTNGMTFYLQDVSNGKALTAANTIATTTVTVN